MLTGLILVLLIGIYFLLKTAEPVSIRSGYALAEIVPYCSNVPARLYKSYQIWDVEVAVSPPPTESPQAVAAKVIAAQAGAIE